MWSAVISNVFLLLHRGQDAQDKQFVLKTKAKPR